MSKKSDPSATFPGPRDLEARVVRPLPNEMFLVVLPDGSEVHVHAAGKMRIQLIRVLPGDIVRIQLSPFDQTKGRIVGRG